MANIEETVKWMQDRKGKVTYSMSSRLGPNSYDCSSAVYFALIAGGFLPSNNRIGSTVTLGDDLLANGWSLVPANADGSFTVHRGDIGIWADGPHWHNSAGASGHTFIILDDSENMIHCNFGYNGITINNHDVIWNANGQPNVFFFRYNNGSAPQPTPPAPKPPVTNKKSYRVDDLQLVNGIWQIRVNELVPVDFNWTDNGIPASCVDDFNDQSLVVGEQVVFNSSISDTGSGDYGSGGYYWRQFNTPYGAIWLSAWNLQHLING
jgi:hypothetical protein